MFILLVSNNTTKESLFIPVGNISLSVRNTRIRVRVTFLGSGSPSIQHPWSKLMVRALLRGPKVALLSQPWHLHRCHFHHRHRVWTCELHATFLSIHFFSFLECHTIVILYYCCTVLLTAHSFCIEAPNTNECLHGIFMKIVSWFFTSYAYSFF